MPVWQRLYEDIDDPDFEILCVAEDTGGEAVAGPIFDAASPTYIQVVDEDHLVSSAFNFINVPSAAWIDEAGRIVRIDEGTYAKSHELTNGERTVSFGTDAYAPAVKDWVRRGADSVHVQGAAAVTGNIRDLGSEARKAEAAFRLGNLFRRHGQPERAERFWSLAQTLHPDSINFFRQNLTLTEEGSAGETFVRRRMEYEQEGKDYYRPLDLE